MKSHLGKALLVAICMLTTPLLPNHASADFAELLKQIPDGANALIMIKTAGIEQKASRDNQRAIHNFAEAARFWPAIKSWEPQRLVIAAEMDIQLMSPQWQMACIEFALPPDLERLAKSTNGVADNLLGYDVIWLETACILASGKNQLTLVTPLNRQSATRWLRRIQTQNSIELSPFLAEVAETAAADSTDITLALDLENVFPPPQVAEAVKKNPLFEKIKSDPTKILCSLRGLVIQCQVDAKQLSTIKLEFGEPVDSFAPIAKSLIVRALANAGAVPGDLGGWTGEAAGTELTLSGSLPASALKRLLSITSIGATVANADSAAIEQPATEPAETSDDGKAAAEEFAKLKTVRATKKYFSTVTGIVSEIENEFDRKSMDQNALWLNNYAQKIESLSSREVDSDMVAYGQYVSQALKSMVGNFSQALDQTRVDMRYATPVFGGTTVSNVPIPTYSWGGHRRLEYAPMVTHELNLGYARQERNAIRESGRAQANEAARQILTNIDDATTQIRQAMSTKYNESF